MDIFLVSYHSVVVTFCRPSMCCLSWYGQLPTLVVEIRQMCNLSPLEKFMAITLHWQRGSDKISIQLFQGRICRITWTRIDSDNCLVLSSWNCVIDKKQWFCLWRFMSVYNVIRMTRVMYKIYSGYQFFLLPFLYHYLCIRFSLITWKISWCWISNWAARHQAMWSC